MSIKIYLAGLRWTFLHARYYVMICWGCSLFLGYQQSWWSSWYKILSCWTIEEAARGKDKGARGKDREVWPREDVAKKEKEEQRLIMREERSIESFFVSIVVGRLQTNCHAFLVNFCPIFPSMNYTWSRRCNYFLCRNKWIFCLSVLMFIWS